MRKNKRINNLFASYQELIRIKSTSYLVALSRRREALKLL